MIYLRLIIQAYYRTIMNAALLVLLIFSFVPILTAQPQGRKLTPPGKKIDLMKYRLDVDSNTYIRLGTTNKCPENMRFFAVDGNETTGMCDCDYYECSRPLIYHSEKNQCYFAWSQVSLKFWSRIYKNWEDLIWNVWNVRVLAIRTNGSHLMLNSNLSANAVPVLKV